MRRRLGICGLLLGYLAAAPAFAGQPVAGEDPTIVVTAEPIEALKRDLDQCLAAGCSARDDMAKSLAYAEGLFVAGDYKASRGVVAKSIGRNRGAAEAEPELLSQLFRASGRISVHLGEAERYRMDTHRIVQTLKAGAARDEAELLLSEMEVAEMSLKTGNPRLAERILAMVTKRAKAAELHNLAAIASLRHALMPYIAYGNKPGAIRRLQAMAILQGDETIGAVRTSAKILIARLTAKPNEAPDLSALLVEGDPLPARQVLMWSPPFDADQIVPGNGVDPPSERAQPTLNMQDRWADIGFRVRADGKVEDVTVLRRNGPGNWVDKSVAQVEGRLYSPLPASAVDALGDGDYRVERHSYTSYFQTTPTLGTRTRTRNGVARVEIDDLTS